MIFTLGTILVNSIPSYVLFDSGATHSFLSSRFVAQHQIPLENMPEEWSIATGGGSVICSKVCRGCPVIVGNRKFLSDLIVIGNSAFDIILGMDWLVFTYATIDCRAKKVIFRMPG